MKKQLLILLVMLIVSCVSFFGCNDGKDFSDAVGICLNSYPNEVEQIFKEDLDPGILQDLVGTVYTDTSGSLLIKARAISSGVAGCITEHIALIDTVTVTLVPSSIINALQGTVWSDTAKSLLIKHH